METHQLTIALIYSSLMAFGGVHSFELKQQRTGQYYYCVCIYGHVCISFTFLKDLTFDSIVAPYVRAVQR